jgi:S1-C subfamily serine protease
MFNKSVLRSLSRELSQLGSSVTLATAIVTGQLKDFSGATGSGWLIDPFHVVTNHHVIEGLEPPIDVYMPGHSRMSAELVGSDPYTDLAVLKLSKIVGAIPLQLQKKPPQLGQLCFAFGCPLGEFEESMSMGIVSGLHRSSQSPAGRLIEDAIQIDAAINEGNSGGPLVDCDGFVLGVNRSTIERASNISFAIPASVVAQVVPELLKYGEVQRASLGLKVASQLMDINGDTAPRLTVVALNPSSVEGIEVGDVILAIEGIEIWSSGHLMRILGRDRVQRPTRITLLRAGQLLEVSVLPTVLGKAEPNGRPAIIGSPYVSSPS